MVGASGGGGIGGGRIKGRPPMTKASSFGGTVTLLCRGDSLDVSPTTIKGKLGKSTVTTLSGMKVIRPWDKDSLPRLQPKEFLII